MLDVGVRKEGVFSLVCGVLLIFGPVLGPGAEAVTQNRLPEETPANCLDPADLGGQDISNPEVVGTARFGANKTVVITYNYTTATRPEFVVKPSSQVISSTGFNETLRGAYIANNSSQRHKIRLIPKVGRNSRTRSMGDNWALLNTLSHSDGVSLNLPEAYVGRNFMVVGQVSTYRSRAGCEKFVLVVPSGANLKAQPEKIVDVYSRAARVIHIGNRYEVNRIFVSPTSLGEGLGGYTPRRSNEALVLENMSLETAWNPWIHEYIHIRQTMDRHPSFLWYNEASASYFSSRAALEIGLASPRQYDAALSRLSKINNSTTMAPNTAPTSLPAYYYGFAILDTLDRILITNTNTSLMNITRRVNQLHNPRHAKFLSMLNKKGLSNQTVENITAVAHHGTRPDPDYLLGPSWLGPKPRRAIAGAEASGHTLVGPVFIILAGLSFLGVIDAVDDYFDQ